MAARRRADRRRRDAAVPLVPPPAPAGGCRGWPSARRCRSWAGCWSPSPWALFFRVSTLVRRHLRAAGRHRGAAAVGLLVVDGDPLRRRGGGPARGGPGRRRRPQDAEKVAESEPDAARRRRSRPGSRRGRMTTIDAEPATGAPAAPIDPPPDAQPRPARRSRASSACPPPKATASTCCATATRSSPSMLEAIERRRAHDRLPHVRLLGGRRRARVRRPPVRPGPRRRAGARPPRRLGRPRAWRRRSIEEMEAAGVAAALVPAAAAAVARLDQPPHPPQGADRRRGGGVHRRRRHRRRVAGRRPRRERVAGHPLPPRGARPSTGCGPPSSTTGPRPTRRCSTTASTASRTSPSRAHAVVQCVRGASETGWSDMATLFRTLLQLAERQVRITTPYFVPDDDLGDRLCAAADRGVDVADPPARAPHRQAVRPDRRRRPSTSGCWSTACASGTSSRPCSTPR